jgi:U3 small nucleolar RNA-associated protein 22
MNDLGGHCIQVVVAYLFQTRRIGVQTTKLGAFQVVINFLAQTDFASADLHFTGAKSSSSESKWSAKLYHPISKDVDDVQFNSLWRISFSAVQDLQNEARIALGLLQQESNTAFSRIFLEERHYLSRYDLLFQVPLTNISSSSSSVDLIDSISPSDGDAADRAEDSSRGDDETIPQFLCSKVLTIARRALTNRVKYVSSSLRDGSVKVGSVGQSHVSSSWDRHSEPVNSLSSFVVTLGLVLDNDNAHRRVDKGADSSSAGSLSSDQAVEGEMFRSFWGSKSELRRFKDGAIVDAVVWGEQDIQADEHPAKPTSSSDGGTSVSTPREVTGVAIVEAIVRYSLCRHVLRAVARREYISCLGGTLEALLPGTIYTRRGLPEGTVIGHQKALDSNPKTRYLHAIEALDKLRSILTSDIKDLPLVFESITGSEAALRYTSFVPPMPSPLLLNTKDKMKEYSGVTLSLMAQPLQIIGQVEGGGKWPTEVEAARKVKTALLLRTASLLRSQFEVNTTSHR